jgi:hypothetical protein
MELTRLHGLLGSSKRFAGGCRAGICSQLRKGGSMYIGVGALILIILLVIFVF